MYRYLALTLPDGTTLKAPGVIPQGGLENGGKGQTIIQNGLTIFLISVAVLSMIFFIWGGIKWITSSGDKSKIETARKTIIYSLVGLILSFLSFTIVIFIGSRFGVSFFGS